MTLPNVTRPALRYFGAKFRLSDWIIDQFPDHTCYVEPFGGSAGVLLQKKPSLFEVYNDLDGEVVNFFRQLRDHPDELLNAIQLTPFSREEQHLSFQPAVDDLERARRLYVRCWQSHGGGRTQWRTGWRYQVTNKRGKSQMVDWNQIDHLEAIVGRLKMVQLEHDQALNVIERHDRPSTLFYLDPPYVSSTRSERWGEKAYTCEMTDDDHVQLGAALNSIQGMAIISGKQCELYTEMFKDWKRLQRTVQTDFNSQSIECLWISPNALARINQKELF